MKVSGESYNPVLCGIAVPGGTRVPMSFLLQSAKCVYNESMLIRACMAKIHRATVTQADLNYVGSITIDEDIVEKAGMRPYQMVHINNVANGVHWETYVIAGERGSGVVCLNGPPARIFQPGDKIIILAEVYLEPSEMKDLNPVVVFVDEKNKVTKVEKHKAIPIEASR